MPQLARRSLSFGEGGLFVALAPGEGASAIAWFRLSARPRRSVALRAAQGQNKFSNTR